MRILCDQCRIGGWIMTNANWSAGLPFGSDCLGGMCTLAGRSKYDSGLRVDGLVCAKLPGNAAGGRSQQSG
jgi:hypothetical protein